VDTWAAVVAVEVAAEVMVGDAEAASAVDVVDSRPANISLLLLEMTVSVVAASMVYGRIALRICGGWKRTPPTNKRICHFSKKFCPNAALTKKREGWFVIVMNDRLRLFVSHFLF